jgi:hypothetical protein
MEQSPRPTSGSVPSGPLTLALSPRWRSICGSNEFLSTLASGAANIGVPGTGGRGTLSGGSLEQSNVDISTQLADLNCCRERISGKRQGGNDARYDRAGHDYLIQ